jgi:membrane protein
MKRATTDGQLTSTPRSGALLFALGFLAGLSVVFLEEWSASPPGASDKGGAPRIASPLETPSRDWRSGVKRAWIAFNSDQIPAVAGGATFFGLLALFPALGVFVSLYGLFADVEQARMDLANLKGVLPDGAISVLSEQIGRLAAAPRAQLGLAFLVSALISVWSANAGVKALIAGLNIAYRTAERRGFIRLNATSLAFTVAGVGLAALAAAVPGWLSRLGPPVSTIIALLRWPVFLATVVTLLSLVYRYAPSRESTRWRLLTPGSLFAAIAWLAMSLLFSFYVSNFGTYDRTYGSLGAIVGFMTWIWLSLTVVLVGAELNAQLEGAGS